MVVTFAEHPRKVLHSDFQPALLTSLSEKIEQLQSTGIDTCVVLHFTPEIAKLSAFDFLKNVLQHTYNVQTLLVGHDHRFGHNRTDGFPEYKKFGESIGMEVIQATRYSLEISNHVSSSEIRKFLQQGDVEKAAQILTYHYSISGLVVDGFKVGRKIGFPTANIVIEDNEKLIPAMGVYAVQVYWNNHVFKGMLNIGLRPTLNNGNELSCEVHIIDFNENIYNETIRIDFIRKIRDEQKFETIEQLVEQLFKDREKVLSMIF
jgi:riboflavin kinase/FMN adenylyltransferase